ncbi:uncharacterized protein LOC141988455 [Natator depressus]|uniref:uncharacterized protein LOC141988455 n=1 Tax=Natator depressus TaxID=27790 RepID=UPI003EB6EAAC
MYAKRLKSDLVELCRQRGLRVGRSTNEQLIAQLEERDRLDDPIPVPEGSRPADAAWALGPYQAGRGQTAAQDTPRPFLPMPGGGVVGSPANTEGPLTPAASRGSSQRSSPSLERMRLEWERERKMRELEDHEKQRQHEEKQRQHEQEEKEKQRQHEQEEKEKQRQHEQEEKEKQRQHEEEEKEKQRQHEQEEKEKQRQHEQEEKERERQEKERERQEKERERQHEQQEKEKQRQHELELARLRSSGAPAAEYVARMRDAHCQPFSRDEGAATLARQALTAHQGEGTLPSGPPRDSSERACTQWGLPDPHITARSFLVPEEKV